MLSATCIGKTSRLWSRREPRSKLCIDGFKILDSHVILKTNISLRNIMYFGSSQPSKSANTYKHFPFYNRRQVCIICSCKDNKTRSWSIKTAFLMVGTYDIYVELFKVVHLP